MFQQMTICPSPRPSVALARGLSCDLTKGDSLVALSSEIALGHFSASPTDPWFTNGGPLQLYYVALPLSTVEIQQNSSAPFVASPATTSYFKPGDRYRRRKIAPSGDQAIYFALTFKALIEMRELVGCKRTTSRRVDGGGFTGSGPLDASTSLDVRLLEFDLRQRNMSSTLELDERLQSSLRRILGETACFNQARPITLQGKRGKGVERNGARNKVERAKEYIAAHFERNISLDELAKAVGTGTFNLARLFRAHAGVSAHDYLTRIRLANSLDMLIDAPGELARIAFNLGFTHHSHFSSRFKQFFGMSPSQYVRRASSSCGNSRSTRVAAVEALRTLDDVCGTLPERL